MDLPSNCAAPGGLRGLGRGPESKKRKVVLSALLIAQNNSSHIIHLAGHLSSLSQDAGIAKRGSLYTLSRFIAALSLGNSPTTDRLFAYTYSTIVG